ncbi:photosynthetic reaction center subunit H [Rhodobacteraceae bacterium N5(2021)]|uniref:Photosynthetic reaction center subunit H n=1 Tax=Gymnodinialimonas phycosphaerae TaxID=2841589 RepID=A0A975TTC6_9RHOB|nr:photosynthetic reaction center subunit H [Gymnodinialimonas phycosphaerae]MBY4894226.1 photosynthetic reaction center subunit H [Gymnodinialimonas phycosphaerae]
MENAFFGNFDLASLSIWLFWIFFALLIYYLQTENMREGYPLENDDGTAAPNQGPFPVPDPKTFLMPHGRADVTVPSAENEEAHYRHDLDDVMEAGAVSHGFPYDPKGDPMLAGIGSGAWTPRRDEPELDGHGHVKIEPMKKREDMHVSAGKNPLGMTVVAGDGEEVGTISDMWIDVPEQLVRYLEITLDADHGGGTRLVPIHFCQIWRRVTINAIHGKHFAGVPTTKSDAQITKLEEEKISAYYGAGILYADDKRAEPLL